MENFALISSTLPIQVLKKRYKKWKIGTIIVASDSLYDSATTVFKEKDGLEIIKIILNKDNKLLNYWKLFWLIKKLKERKLFFFHECAFPIADFIIFLCKPKSYLLPQVGLNSYKDITYKEIK